MSEIGDLVRRLAGSRRVVLYHKARRKAAHVMPSPGGDEEPVVVGVRSDPERLATVFLRDRAPAVRVVSPLSRRARHVLGLGEMRQVWLAYRSGLSFESVEKDPVYGLARQKGINTWKVYTAYEEMVEKCNMGSCQRFREFAKRYPASTDHGVLAAFLRDYHMGVHFAGLERAYGFGKGTKGVAVRAMARLLQRDSSAGWVFLRSGVVEAARRAMEAMDEGGVEAARDMGLDTVRCRMVDERYAELIELGLVPA